MSRVWAALGDAWLWLADFAAARARGCQQRMRRAMRRLPPNEIPANPAGEGDPR